MKCAVPLVLVILASQAYGQSQFLKLPLQDPITSVWNGWIYRPPNYPTKHRAIDYKVPQYTVVFAAADGLAISSCQPPLSNTDPSKDTYGQFVFIAHPNGYTTLYAHLDSILIPAASQLPCDDKSRQSIKAGNIVYPSTAPSHTYIWTPVKAGDPIGKVGKTGTTYYHLHFEVAPNTRGDYGTHYTNKADPYAIGNIYKFYPPPASRCTYTNAVDYLWTQCPPVVTGTPPNQTFDALAQLDMVHNPSPSGWSYGYKTSLFAPLLLFPYVCATGTFLDWCPAPGVLYPDVETSGGLSLGTQLTHGVAIVRWTSTVSGTAAVNSTFTGYWTGVPAFTRAGVHVLFNGVSVFDQSI